MDGGTIVRVEGWMDDMWMNRWMLYNIGINVKCHHQSISSYKVLINELPITYFEVPVLI